MYQDDVIKQLQDEIAQLKQERELLKKRVQELESLLAKYENAHTPPSLKRGGRRKKSQNKGEKGKPGQKKGHKGTTRPFATPDVQVEVTENCCPYCETELGDPIRVESRIIEEIPEPQPVIVTEFKIAHYRCPCCQKEVIATNENCPKEGMFGNNIIAQATLMKYADRLPHRKIQNALWRLYGLDICPATILDLTRRSADAVQPQYEEILDKVRNAPILYVDETSIKVQGVKYWIWVFTTASETFFAVRNSRGMKVLMEVLTRKFKGIIVCDGWRSYTSFTKRIQRCWAHLLRESKDLTVKIEEAVPLHKALLRLYKKLVKLLGNDPPPEVRKQLWYEARATLRRWIRKSYADEKVKKLIGKISNGFEYWFTFVIHPGVEPTNNRAERALRENVVLRKIIGTLRNMKGTMIHERITTVLATWEQQGLNSLQMMKAKLSGC
jgi:transposase